MSCKWSGREVAHGRLDRSARCDPNFVFVRKLTILGCGIITNPGERFTKEKIPLKKTSLQSHHNYNYINKEQILYIQEYLRYICIITNIFICSRIIPVLLEDIKSSLLLIHFFQYQQSIFVVSESRFQLNVFLFPII